MVGVAARGGASTAALLIQLFGVPDDVAALLDSGAGLSGASMPDRRHCRPAAPHDALKLCAYIARQPFHSFEDPQEVAPFHRTMACGVAAGPG